ncbi:helix-turn-helix domain-containing protein [Virgibacillus sp. AGTR]|uniref:helix-turn-helix domain-containing protein n=1 Tax=Virgibacillus sp. AGTR TaxID=2812055 RepID=UPI001D1660F1|nr:helix-turn-helix transcriptional regulator [Virgibacillus sp. AGTR]MCC2248819.1 helix-turn-helix domain-containing protein [Virgibacillus sp. AGTR]
MSLVKRIKSLCNDKKVTFAEVERKIGISNGQIRRWDNVSPKSETLQKVADYFNVSVDYLLGRTDKKTLVEDDETIAAHHDGEEWTEEELEEIEEFKRFVAMRREARKNKGD